MGESAGPERSGKKEAPDFFVGNPVGKFQPPFLVFIRKKSVLLDSPSNFRALFWACIQASKKAAFYSESGLFLFHHQTAVFRLSVGKAVGNVRPMDANKLTAQFCRKIEPTDQVQRFSDGGGLFLEVRPTGYKVWRYAFRWHGRQQLLTLGGFPDIPLSAARDLHGEARRLLASGVNPCAEKRRTEEGAKFALEAVAAQWVSSHARKVSEIRKKHIEATLRNHVLPFLGQADVRALTGGNIIRWMRRLEASDTGPTAIVQARVVLGMVLEDAVARDLIETSPLASRAVRRAVVPPKTQHFDAPQEPSEAGKALRILWTARTGDSSLDRVCLVLPYLASRPGEAVAMRWEDIDTAAGEWRFTTPKTSRQHIVPLSRQALRLLGEPCDSGWVFPSFGKAGHIHPISPTQAYKAAGLQGLLSPHGCRAMFRTLASERLGYPAEVLEIQLAHRVPGPMGDTYQRARFLEQRRRLMQEWADYIDALRLAAPSSGV